MKSYVLSLVLKWVLPKGLDWLKSAEVSHQAEIDAWFAERFPSHIWDAAEKALVDKAVPALLTEAKNILERFNHAGEVGEDDIFAAITAAVKAMFA